MLQKSLIIILLMQLKTLAVKAVLWIIRENCNFEGILSFTEISDDFVEKQINKINVNKATGFDGLLVKIMKIAVIVKL